MNIPGYLGEVDNVGVAQHCQVSIDGVEQIVSRDISAGCIHCSLNILKKSLGNVEMRE